jgi:hypothetical protein
MNVSAGPKPPARLPVAAPLVMTLTLLSLLRIVEPFFTAQSLRVVFV